MPSTRTVRARVISSSRIVFWEVAVGVDVLHVIELFEGIDQAEYLVAAVSASHSRCRLAGTIETSERCLASRPSRP